MQVVGSGVVVKVLPTLLAVPSSILAVIIFNMRRRPDISRVIQTPKLSTYNVICTFKYVRSANTLCTDVN